MNYFILNPNAYYYYFYKLIYYYGCVKYFGEYDKLIKSGKTLAYIFKIIKRGF